MEFSIGNLVITEMLTELGILGSKILLKVYKYVNRI